MAGFDVLPFRANFRRGTRTRGQALVELALVVPVMLALLVGALDLGRLFYAQITINGAAREGALEAARNPNSFKFNTPCDITNNRVMCRVMTEASGGWVSVGQNQVFVGCPTAPASTPAPATGAVPSCPSSPALGNVVEVRVQGTFHMITGPTFNLASTADTQIGVAPLAAATATPTPTPTPGPTPTPTPTPGPTPTPTPTATPVPNCPAPTLTQITYSPGTVNAQNNGGQQGTLVTFGSNATNMTKPPLDAGCLAPVWSWQFGSSGTSGIASPQFTFPHSTANTNQTVTLTVSNYSGTGTPQSATTFITIPVN
jgi:Flp pilus assembly protein TadG